jgi:WD40 repeat protein
MVIDRTGRWLLSATERTAKLLNANDLSLMQEFVGHTDYLWCALFSRDGRRIFTGSADGTIRIWETDTGRLILTLKAHDIFTRCLTLSPDGNRLVSAAHVGDIKLWDATPLSE